MVLGKYICRLFVFLSVFFSNLNVVKSQDLSDLNYITFLGGTCLEMKIDNDDFTDDCDHKFTQMSLKNGLVVYMFYFKDGISTVSFSGSKDEQETLDTYKLFVDTSRMMVENDLIAELTVVGSCKMWGNPNTEFATHICSVESMTGENIEFKFRSDPQQIEVINDF